MFYSETLSSRYSYVAMILHWVMAALILFMIWLGWNMDDNEAGYQIHKTVGIVLLLLTVARLLWRWANPPPSLPDGITLGEARVSNAVHAAFYTLMVAMPLLGWLMVSVSPFQIKTVLFGFVPWPHIPFTRGLQSEGLFNALSNLHGLGAWGFLILLALHVGGAFKHQFIGERRPVLPRMVPKVFGEAEPPVYLTRGAQFVFGVPLAAFLLLTVSTAITRALPGPGARVQASIETPALPGAQQVSADDIAPNWAVDLADSEIRFSGTHDGNDFTGTFKSWDARVAFYPEDLMQSVVIVTVDVNSASTGKKLYDDTIKIEEWFDVQNYPQAVVRLTNFQKQADGYISDATLVLKGAAHTVPLQFKLAGENDDTQLEGVAQFSRKALNLGQTSDPSGGWVSDLIEVRVTGKAKRTDAPEVAVSVSDAQSKQPRAVETVKPAPKPQPKAAPATVKTTTAPKPANVAAKPVVTPAAKPTAKPAPKPQPPPQPADADAAAPSVLNPAPSPSPAVTEPPVAAPPIQPPITDPYVLEQIRKAQEGNGVPSP